MDTTADRRPPCFGPRGPCAAGSGCFHGPRWPRFGRSWPDRLGPDPDRANTARGAAHFLSETVGRVRYCGARGQLTVRADSGFYTPVCTRSTHFHRPAPLAACKAAFPAGVLQGWTPDAPAHAALGGVHLLEMRAPLFHIQEHVGQTTLHCRVTSRS